MALDSVHYYPVKKMIGVVEWSKWKVTQKQASDIAEKLGLDANDVYRYLISRTSRITRRAKSMGIDVPEQFDFTKSLDELMEESKRHIPVNVKQEPVASDTSKRIRDVESPSNMLPPSKKQHIHVDPRVAEEFLGENDISDEEERSINRTLYGRTKSANLLVFCEYDQYERTKIVTAMKKKIDGLDVSKIVFTDQFYHDIATEIGYNTEAVKRFLLDVIKDVKITVAIDTNKVNTQGSDDTIKTGEQLSIGNQQ
jgi:hypothetical protein